MNWQKNKTKLTTTIAIILMALSLLMTANTSKASAQLATQQPISGPLPAGIVPNATVTLLKAFLSFSPTVIGVGQSLLVNVWTTPAPGADRRHTGYLVTITKPDGTKDTKTLNSYVADGTAWFSYAVDQIGTWKIKFDFPGDYFPAGRYSSGNIITATTGGTVYTESVYYAPSSTSEQTLTVLQNMVASWPPTPLPTDYWTRPVTANIREWWPILGNYPWVMGNAHDFAGPYVIAPNTAHVAWRRQGTVEGLIGGEYGQLSLDASQSIGAPAGGSPSLVYAGRAYQTWIKPGVGNVAQCYDLRTGEVYYEIPGGVTPTVISYTLGTGVVPGAAGSIGIELLSIGSQLMKIDPWTGLVTTNVTAMSGTFYNYQYVLSVQNLGTGRGYRLINWTTAGSSTNFTTRIISNITWPWSSLGSVYDFNAGVSVTISTVAGTGGAFTSQNITAASLTTGNIMWSKVIPGGTFSGSCNVADNGKVAVLVDLGYYVGFDLQTGNQVWQSPTMDYPWDAPAFGAYDVASAYGLFYRSAYSGVYAFDWNTGKIAWKFEAPTPFAFETPYIDSNGTSVYSWNGGMLVADGKVFDYNTEHSPTEPIARGWKLCAINATTGAGVWNITAYSGSRSFRGAAADGYLAFDNFYDGYMWVFGKGKSATTITAPDVAVAKGNAVVIKGTVLDLSPAQPNTPCVSKDSMTTQMEYLHVQYPIDGLWHNATITGVPVKLTAIGSDGSVVDLGIVTSDGYYGTFSKTWAPTNEGDYKIVASFAGDDSYGSSSASTSVSVGPAPTTPIIPQTIVPDYTNTITEAAVAIILAVVIAIAVVGVLMLRRK